MELATQKQLHYIDHLAGDTSYTMHGSLLKGQASNIIDRLIKKNAEPVKVLKSSEYYRIELMAGKGFSKDRVLGQREYQQDVEAFDAAVNHFYK